jgi:hypothetical protein
MDSTLFICNVFQIVKKSNYRKPISVHGI